MQGEVKGSAGYVVMEGVTGTLAGHKGTFALQHIGVRNRGVPELSVTVVPDSGTGDGKHSYDFEYALAH